MASWETDESDTSAYYAILNVPRTASQEEITKAYRKLAQVGNHALCLYTQSTLRSVHKSDRNSVLSNVSSPRASWRTCQLVGCAQGSVREGAHLSAVWSAC